MLFELNEHQIKNLSVFMGRVQLQGTEVQVFNNIVNALQKPIKENNNLGKTL